MKIAVVAPSNPMSREAADKVEAIVRGRGDCDLFIHPQCFLEDGHFAGSDEQRLSALREMMADTSVDAVWFARGGYGSNRIDESAVSEMPDAARPKTFMGYSEKGFQLAA
jgi:muramoyltetrapeptide carboxypeptidase